MEKLDSSIPISIFGKPKSTVEVAYESSFAYTGINIQTIGSSIPMQHSWISLTDEDDQQPELLFSMNKIEF